MINVHKDILKASHKNKKSVNYHIISGQFPPNHKDFRNFSPFRQSTTQKEIREDLMILILLLLVKECGNLFTPLVEEG